MDVELADNTWHGLRFSLPGRLVGRYNKEVCSVKALSKGTEGQRQLWWFRKSAGI